jgi:hypothetical protein
MVGRLPALCLLLFSLQHPLAYVNQTKARVIIGSRVNNVVWQLIFRTGVKKGNKFK